MPTNALEATRRAEVAAIAQRTGRLLVGWGLLGYTPEQERELLALPAYGNARVALQNADGSLAFAPQDDGSRTAGSFGIDSFGRFVAL